MAFKDKVRQLIESRAFQTFIIAVIVFNAVVIGLQTVDLGEQAAGILKVIDWICLGIYIVEAIMKLYVYKLDYFKDGWNVFDFVIIALSLVPTTILPVPVQVARILRLLRIARVFRLVSAFKQLRILVEAIGKSAVGVAWTGLLLLVLMYIFDVAGVALFGSEFPQYFGDLPTGLFTLFEFVTLEGWTTIAQDIMAVYPLAWLYFVPYIIISAFVLINVVLGIILGTIEESTQAARIDSTQDEEAQLMTELAELKAQIRTVEHLLEKQKRDKDGENG